MHGRKSVRWMGALAALLPLFFLAFLGIGARRPVDGAAGATGPQESEELGRGSRRKAPGTPSQGSPLEGASAAEPGREARSDERRAEDDLAAYATEGTREIVFPALAWKVGDTWCVESHYLQAQHEETPSWMARPILWQYAVRERGHLDGIEVYLIDVEAVDASDMPYNPGGRLYVSVRDHSLVAVRDRALERGRVRERFTRYDEAAGSALSTLFPAELPLAGQVGRERTSGTGTLPPHPFAPDPAAAPVAAPGRVVDVAFEANGATVRQRWDGADLRWPLHTRTRTRVSYRRG